MTLKGNPGPRSPCYDCGWAENCIIRDEGQYQPISCRYRRELEAMQDDGE